MRWFIAPTFALPLKLVLLAALLWGGFVAIGDALVKVPAAAAVTMAVLGVVATALAFPVLLAVIVGGVMAYASPLVTVPRVWRTARSRLLNIALTLALVLGSALIGGGLFAVAGQSISWIADRNPCAAFHAGVTGTVRPSPDCFASGPGSAGVRPSAVEPYVVRCKEPLPEFTLGEKSNPTKEQVATLCACIWDNLGSWERRASEQIAAGKGSEVSWLHRRALPSRFGGAVEKCGGMKL
jgi:hypothetical protein